MSSEGTQAPAAAPAKGKRRWLVISILGVVLVATPAVTWFALDFSKSGAGKPAAKPVKKRAYPLLGAPPNLAIPLVRTQVVFIAQNDDKGIPPFIVPTNAAPAKPIEKMVIVLADPSTNKVHHAVMQIFLIGKNTDALIHKLNQKQPLVYQAVENRLASKTIKDTQAPGFRNLLRTELIQVCNRVLEANLVQDVVITDFVAQ